MRVAVVLAIALLTASNVYAGGSTQRNTTGCFASANTQYDMDVCAGREFKKADAALNALNRQMRPRYDVADQALLKDAERKWLDYRDAEYAFDSNSTIGGTFHPTAETMCRTEKTETRVKELKAQFDCPEGDLGCNRPSK